MPDPNFLLIFLFEFFFSIVFLFFFFAYDDIQNILIYGIDFPGQKVQIEKLFVVRFDKHVWNSG